MKPELDYWSKLHVLICMVEEVYDCDYIPKIDLIIEKLSRSIEDIKSIYNVKSHKVNVKKAIKEYKLNKGEKPNPTQKDAALYPFTIDIEKIRRERYERIVENYEPYWNKVLGSLKQKKAIINRKKYLIEQIDAITIKCKEHSYLELIDRLQPFRDSLVQQVEQNI